MLEYAQLTPRPFELVTAENTQSSKLYGLMYWRYHLRQDSQCTYKLTLKRVRATTVAVENQRVLYIVSTYVALVPARNVHAPYCHLWPVPLYYILPHYLINGTIFEKSVIEHKICVLIFSATFVWNISHSKKNLAWYDQKYKLVFM